MPQSHEGSVRGSRKRASVLRVVLINAAVFLALIVALEGAARVAIYFARGKSTAGMPERFKYLTYEPFVMYGPDWNSVLAPTSHAKGNRSGRTRRILLLGGSTAALFPSEILEDAFEAGFPGYTFEVINAGFGGYNARQELIVASIWGIGLKPDIIISLDGANDLNHRLRLDESGTFFADPDYALALKRPFVSPVAHILRHSQALQGMRRLWAGYGIGPVAQYLDAIPVYISAQHGMNVLARGSSATRLMVLQPYLPFKEPLSGPEKSFKWYKYREPVLKPMYRVANERLTELAEKDRVFYLDGRSIFNGMNRTIFRDDVHFVDGGAYRILAEAMAGHLQKRQWKPQQWRGPNNGNSP